MSAQAGEIMSDFNQKINEALKLHQSAKLDEAQVLYSELLQEQPSNGNVLNLFGFLNIQKNKYEDAIFYLKKATGIYANFFDAWFNLALAYKKNQEPQKSIETYKKALLINPESSEAYYNLGGVYDNLNDMENALECYKKAYEYNKNLKDSEIQYALGIIYLKMKDFKNGLTHYEHRLCKDFAILTQVKQYQDLITSKPLWNGEDIKDKTLYVYYEAGLGDTLMFARYLDVLKDKCKKVLFQPQMCFINLFKDNNLGAEIVDIKDSSNPPEFDYHIPIMSIPYVLKYFSEKDIPLTEGYLKANPQKVLQYKEKYFNTNKFKIGIKWKGNVYYDIERAIRLESFYSLIDLPNVQFYSLQVGDGIEELEKIPEKYNILNLGDIFNDFSDTAAAIENCDLIICNDTSIAHLAGAMNKSCWVLLPFVQNWRWSTDISYCYWYNSIKLFKQKEQNSWDKVFEEVLRHCEAWVSG